MHLTPAILKANYNYLKETPPFRRWGLPEGDEISWFVTNTKKHEGECSIRRYKDNRRKPIHRISISAALIKASDSLTQVMAHEMCHLRNDMVGVKSHHGYEFKRLAKMVCRDHGWREELF